MGRKRHALGEAGSEAVSYQEAGDPLLMALFQGDVEGAKRLIEADQCSIEAADHLGWRPLHRAAFGGFDEVVALLLERKADATAGDTDGLQPLHIAASCGHVESCRRLLSARADPTAPDRYTGMTAQMYTLAQEGEVGEALQAVLGTADLQLFAAMDNPLAMARHIAAASTEEERSALEQWWAAHGQECQGDARADTQEGEFCPPCSEPAKDPPAVPSAGPD
mmetsp:Transcript_57716/g.185485  ORF Transcript_57716/g.185485 Transcript_57716/m.185485 type:complete len:222 (+) Transcript_57716:45-710(+)